MFTRYTKLSISTNIKNWGENSTLQNSESNKTHNFLIKHSQRSDSKEK